MGTACSSSATTVGSKRTATSTSSGHHPYAQSPDGMAPATANTNEQQQAETQLIIDILADGTQNAHHLSNNDGHHADLNMPQHPLVADIVGTTASAIAPVANLPLRSPLSVSSPHHHRKHANSSTTGGSGAAWNSLSLNSGSHEMSLTTGSSNLIPNNSAGGLTAVAIKLAVPQLCDDEDDQQLRSHEDVVPHLPRLFLPPVETFSAPGAAGGTLFSPLSRKSGGVASTCFEHSCSRTMTPANTNGQEFLRGATSCAYPPSLLLVDVSVCEDLLQSESRLSPLCQQ